MRVKSWLGWALWGNWKYLAQERACARQGHEFKVFVVEAGPGGRRGRSCQCGERRIWGPSDHGESTGVREPRRPAPTPQSGGAMAG
jgi:hypothetical protein